jgi:hypothetical protein
VGCNANERKEEEWALILGKFVNPCCMSCPVLGVRARGIQKIHAYVLVPKSFMKFMFSTVYRVTQKDLYSTVRTLQRGHLL